MEMENLLHLANFFFMLITASAPLYIALRVGRSNNRLLLLSVTLAVFAFVHSLYHLADFMELTSLADGLLLPFSVILLVIFGIYYARSGA